MAGAVVHFEIPVDDPARAQGFYTEAFGWRATPVPEMDYILLGTTPVDENGRPTEPGAINGGMMRPQEPFSHPIAVIDVEDIDAALSTVERLGGKTVRPRVPVGDMGFTAYFTDTEGNLVGLWQTAG
jgi:uncharacterized protein